MSAKTAPLLEDGAPDVPAEALVEALLYGATELHELHGDTVPTMVGTPSALDFARIVARHQPVVIEGAVDDWPAMTRWQSDQYLAEQLGDDRLVTVTATPDGFADAVRDGHFVQPMEERMPYARFVDLRRQSLHTNVGVYYVQRQNGNLTSDDEFAPLLADVAPDISFASEALGRAPEAVNIWIGTSLSTTSLHKDHYENLYVVVTGQKHFTLYPPSDFPFLYEREFPTARWVRDVTSGVFHRVSDDPPDTVPWMAVDPEYPDFREYPRFSHAHPIHVTISAGQMLYIPALYYHHVKQSNDDEGRCIAVNYWWDMDFDARWASYQTIRELTKLLPT